MPDAPRSAVLGGFLKPALRTAAGVLGVGWAASALAMLLSGGSDLRVPARMWLVAHGSGLVLGEARIGVVPLGVTLVVMGLTAAIAHRVARAEMTDLGGFAGAVGMMIGIAAAVLAAIVSTDNVVVSIPRAAIGGLLVGGLGAALGAGWRHRAQLSVSTDVGLVIRGATRALLAVLGASLVLVILMLGVHGQRAADMWGLLDPGLGGAIVLAVACLLSLPTLVLWTASVLIGPGFTLGTDTSVDLTGSYLGAIPGFPTLAAVPNPGAFGPWVLVLGTSASGPSCMRIAARLVDRAAQPRLAVDEVARRERVIDHEHGGLRPARDHRALALARRERLRERDRDRERTRARATSSSSRSRSRSRRAVLRFVAIRKSSAANFTTRARWRPIRWIAIGTAIASDADEHQRREEAHYDAPSAPGRAASARRADRAACASSGAIGRRRGDSRRRPPRACRGSFVEERVHPLEVLLPDRGRIDEHPVRRSRAPGTRSGRRTGTCARADRATWSTETSWRCARSCASASSVSSSASNRSRREHDQRAPPARQLGDPAQRGGRRLVAVAALARSPVEHGEQIVEVRRARARRHERLDRAVAAREQADLVLLLDHEVRERGERRGPRTRASAMPPPANCHRRRRVEHEVDGQLRLLLELLDVVAVDLRVRLPVDVAQLVAGRVLLVLGELDRRAVHARAVHARQRALDDHARLDRQRCRAARAAPDRCRVGQRGIGRAALTA